MAQLSLLRGVRVVNFDQRQHGAHTVKSARLIYFGLDSSSLYARCQHLSLIHISEPTRLALI
eukprot:6731610-Alexandrium_andersonii.AAC.1